MLLRLFAILTLASSAAFSQSWDSLRELKPGDRVVILDRTGNDHKGEFRSYTADTIRITNGKGEDAIERTKIRRVQVRASSRRLRHVLIGAGIGVGIGITVDQTFGTYFRNESGQSEGARALTYVAPIAI